LTQNNSTIQKKQVLKTLRFLGLVFFE